MGVQRIPRWPNRKSKGASTWLQYGYSKTKEYGQDGTNMAIGRNIEGPLRRPRWRNRRQKGTFRWHPDGNSKSKPDGQDGIKAASGKNIGGSP